MRNIGFLWVGQFAVSPTLRGKIENDRPRRHAFHHVRSYKYWSLLARNDRRRDDCIVFGNNLSQQFALFGVERFILRFCISASILGVLSFKREFDEARAQALHLLLYRRPHIV